MKTKLNAIIEKHNKLSKQMADPDVYSNQKKLTEIAKEHRSIDGVVLVGKKFLRVSDQIEDAKSIMQGDDEELKEIAQEELPLLEKENLPVFGFHFAICSFPEYIVNIGGLPTIVNPSNHSSDEYINLEIDFITLSLGLYFFDGKSRLVEHSSHEVFNFSSD